MNEEQYYEGRDMYLYALQQKYEAEVFMAKANLSTYLHHSVGVAEHPNVIESMDEIVCKLAEAEDKLNIIKKYRGML